MNKIQVSIPINILCKRKGNNKQDSFFYAGNDIAKVKILNREYVLTTSGMYDFGLINGRRRNNTIDRYTVAANDIRRFRDIARNYRLTDARIKKLTDDGATVSNWGWFGINVWDEEEFISNTATDCYSEYDEALNAFIDFIQKDLNI